jgi:hypothetical protein
MGRATMITAVKTAGSLVRAALIGSLHRGRERRRNIWGMRAATAPALTWDDGGRAWDGQQRPGMERAKLVSCRLGNFGNSLLRAEGGYAAVG